MSTTTELPFAVENDEEAKRAPSEAERGMALAQSWQIETRKDLELAANDLARLTAQRNAIEGKRKFLKEPYLEGGRRVDEFFRAPLARYDEAISLLRGLMVGFERKERERIDRERREAEERARQEAAEAERIAREAEEAARAAQAAGDEQLALEMASKAESAREEAELAIVAPALPAETAPKVAGASFRGTWKARVIDKAALIKAAAEKPELQNLLEVSTTAINAMAKAVKNASNIPGLEFYEDRTVATRGGGR